MSAIGATFRERAKAHACKSTRRDLSRLLPNRARSPPHNGPP